MTDPAPVVFWSPGPCRAALQGVLERLSAQVPGLAPVMHDEAALADTLPAVLADPSGPACVVIWSGLADHLTECLENHLADPPVDSPTVVDGEMTPATVPAIAPTVALALAAWEERTATILAGFVQARRRVTLVPAAALIARPQTLAGLLAARLAPTEQTDADRDGDAGAADADADAAGADADAPDDLDAAAGDGVTLPPGQTLSAALMAAAVLQTAPVAQRLLDRLEAASLPVPGFGLRVAQTTAGVVALARTMTSARSHKGTETGPETGLRAERDEARAARALIQEAMAFQEETLEREKAAAASAAAEAATLRDRLAAEQTALTARLADRDAELEAARTALARETSAAGAAAETARRLQERLTQGEAEHEARRGATARLDGLETQIRARDKELAILTAEADQRADVIRRQREEIRAVAARRAEVEAAHDALLGSTSWRITAPLRRVVMALRRLRGAE